MSDSAGRGLSRSTLRIGSLCTGYGGLDLGLELALGPVEHAWHVEQADAPSKVLAHRFPGVPNHGDLKALDYASMTPIDILTAGYPCQPFSQAGPRKGTDDPRHLWPYVADTIGHLRPGLVLLENVRGHVRRGFDAVLGDLAELGYDASWGVVRASDAGAPHRRARLFVVATDAARPGCIGSTGADAQAHGNVEPPGGPQPDGLRSQWGAYAPAIARWEAVTGRVSPEPSEPRGRGGASRIDPRWTEWLMGLPLGWVTDVPGLTASERLTMLGNGVVPQQAVLALRLLGVTSQEVAA